MTPSEIRDETACLGCGHSKEVHTGELRGAHDVVEFWLRCRATIHTTLTTTASDTAQEYSYPCSCAIFWGVKTTDAV